MLAIVVAIAFAYAVWLVPTAVILLKGKPGMAAISFFVPTVGIVVGLVSALRLAKPSSWWAEHRYGVYEMDEARARFPGEALVDGRELAFAAWFVLFAVGPALFALGLIAAS